MNKKKTLVLLSSLTAASAYYLCQRKKQDQQRAEGFQSDRTPTVFIPGTFGTKHTLGTFIRRLTGDRAGVTVFVKKDGTFDYAMETEEQPQSIQIIFQDTLAEEFQQAVWLKNVFADIADRWQVSALNFIGHSMGGVVGMRYLVDYSDSALLPKIKKFIAIGAPFDGERKTLLSPPGERILTRLKDIPSERLQYFQNFGKSIPRSVEFLNIYGELSAKIKSDGLVASRSVRALSSFFRKFSYNYQELRFIGINAQHTLLHENSKVDEAIRSFLNWK